ncbi:MAG: putative nucleotidyltransferase component of viral defense system [Paraglaciecola sp.]|jgi:predicted nucleotidyltransferase component of viral defense system
MFTYAAQQHKDGLAANFLEKDVWVTEILRLLYNEKLLGNCSVAFKGGTALSKCWSAIERFSEDIDLSIHWADLSGLSEEDELASWIQSTKNPSQSREFIKQQRERLIDWSTKLVETLNVRLAEYNIDGLYAELEEGSLGEKIDIHFPRVTRGNYDYQLDHVLLEFGGRNRGKPTESIDVNCYMDSISDFNTLSLPKAKVMAYQKDFILWEKLTALHQFSTQNNNPDTTRLARHWYDVDCLLTMKFADPLKSEVAMKAVIDMKKNRWPSPGVNYEGVLAGGLLLIPVQERLEGIIKDHDNAVKGGMFFTTPDDFMNIVRRLRAVQDGINTHIRAVK